MRRKMRPLTPEESVVVSKNYGMALEFVRRNYRHYHPLTGDELLSAAHLGLIGGVIVHSRKPQYALSTIVWRNMKGRASYDRDLKLSMFRNEKQAIDMGIYRSDRASNKEELKSHILGRLDGINPIHYEIVRLRLDGMSGADIAEMSGMTKSGVSYALRMHLGKFGLSDRLPEPVKPKIKKGATA